MIDFKEVCRDEFDAFVRAYPRKLEVDVYGACDPPLITWNDFERAPLWPDSVVARSSGERYSIIADINAPIPDDGKRETDKPITDRNGAVLKEGDCVIAVWGSRPDVSDPRGWKEYTRRDKIIVRYRGTKYEYWSFESCYNYARGFDMVKVDDAMAKE